MKYVIGMRCLSCGAEYAPDQLMNLCPVDDRPVEWVLDTQRIRADFPEREWYQAERRDMWRFGALLPLNAADPEDAGYIVNRGEGATPLREAPALALSTQAGIRLQIKNEGRPRAGFGANPTLSFKDRGMAMAASMAKRAGVSKVVVPTQGNAGDSLAFYARQAGMAVSVIMPDDTPLPVLGSVAAAASADPEVHLTLIQGTIREAGALMKAQWLPEGWFNMATFQEPGWRIEGKKTLGLELAEPLAPGDPWQLPDVILYPTGGGTGILGMWKAFAELEALGVIDSRRPRMLGVQSESTAPLINAIASGANDVTPADPGPTLATGLNVPAGVGHFRVLQILRESGGTALAVSEQEIMDWSCALWRQCDEWICPEAAACFAALEPCLDQGLIRSGERVVIVNTASMEKYLPAFREHL